MKTEDEFICKCIASEYEPTFIMNLAKGEEKKVELTFDRKVFYKYDEWSIHMGGPQGSNPRDEVSTLMTFLKVIEPLIKEDNNITEIGAIE